MLSSKYHILEPIGRGQYGQVFRGFCYETKELVAIKELHLTQQSTITFLRELDVLTFLTHPNLLHLHGLEYLPSRRFLVVDYCDGGSLRDKLESGEPLTLVQAVEYVADILEGLVYLHSRYVCHCDLKPDNILLTHKDGKTVACIGDFGSVSMENLVADASKVPFAMGSPAYMAPERFYGEFSYTADLYAVGVMLYELITGTRPFATVPQKMLSAHFCQKIQFPDTVPFFLRSLIAKALQKFPKYRFQTATEMLQACHLALEVLKASPDDWNLVPEAFGLDCSPS